MATIPTTTSVTKWNRATRHVEATLRSGRYINAETVLIVAGPPRISDMAMDVTTYANLQVALNAAAGSNVSNGSDALYPIGLIEQASLNQVQNVQKIFEIGSRRSYQAGGRVQVVGSLGRVMFRGPSLMRALYAYYPSAIAVANGKAIAKTGVPTSGASPIIDTVGAAIAAPNTPSNVWPDIFFEAGSLTGGDPEASSTLPDAFFINLMSELFSHPFGLGFLLRDNRNNNYGGMYLEDCFITAHSWQVGAASTLITETASLQADAAVPMEFSTGTVGR